MAEVSAHLSLDRNPIAYLQEMGITLEPSSMNALRLARPSMRLINREPDPLLGFSARHVAPKLSLVANRCETTISVRQRVLPDFMIGAHALAHADRLLTRDKALYRTYFPDLELV